MHVSPVVRLCAGLPSQLLNKVVVVRNDKQLKPLALPNLDNVCESLWKIQNGQDLESFRAWSHLTTTQRRMRGPVNM
jgi:hypothetical protein